MDTVNEKLQAWAIQKIKNGYQDDVCLLIGYDLDHLEHADKNGPYQYYKGGFDYFVPVTEKGYGLAKTFIVNGTGYDLYPRSWERIERMADLEDYNTCCLGDASILYARGEEDQNRFAQMQKRLRKNLSNPDFMYKKALEKLKEAMGIYQTMMFSDNLGEVRMAAGFITDFLSVGVAFLNGKYFKHSQINQPAELSEMKELPDNFLFCYHSIVKAGSMDELKKLSHLIIDTARKFLEAKRPKTETPPKPNYHNLANWYHELSYTWRRIYQQCHDNNATKAFVWGCALQHELTVVKEEFGLEEMDLMGYYDAANLLPLHKRAEELENYIVGKITRNGVKIDAYDSIDEFLVNN